MGTVAKKAPKAERTTKAPDYVVADPALADWGRKEIAIAEHEMPGLMAMRSSVHQRGCAFIAAVRAVPSQYVNVCI